MEVNLLKDREENKSLTNIDTTGSNGTNYSDRQGSFGLLFRRIEFWISAIIFVIPLLYLVTDYSINPIFWRYSKKALFQIALLGCIYIGFLLSYKYALPKLFITWRSLFVITLFSILVSLVIAESILQWRDNVPYKDLNNKGRHAPDPEVGHVYYPNFKQTIQTREWRQEWRSNAQGLRADRDFGTKPQGVYRILVIGDSFTVGDQVSLDKTYPGVIQRHFDETFGKGIVEVINAGFPSYGTVHESRWLKKYGRQFEPDLVILGMTPNDLGENLDPLRIVARDGAMVLSKSTGRHKNLWQDRMRWYSIPGRIERSFLCERIKGTPLYRLLRLGYVYTWRHGYMIDQNKESIKRYSIAEKHLIEIRDEAHAMGAHFVLTIIPFRVQLGELRAGLDPWIFGRRFTTFGKEHDFPTLDLLSAFRSHPNPISLYWKEDQHCTSAGYDLIGREIFNFLKTIGTRIGLSMKLNDASNVK